MLALALIKLIISDLAKSVSNEQLKHMLCTVYKIKLSTEIKMGQHRDDAGQLSYMLNYDRYVWVHLDQLTIPLPRKLYIWEFAKFWGAFGRFVFPTLIFSI